MDPRIFLDTNIFLYAAGADHPLRDPCRSVLARVGEGSLQAITNTEVVQEIVYVLVRMGRREDSISLAGHVLAMFPDMLPVCSKDMRLALEILAADPRVPPRDAIHAATMMNAGLRRITSADRHFDDIKGIERIEPDRI